MYCSDCGEEQNVECLTLGDAMQRLRSIGILIFADLEPHLTVRVREPAHIYYISTNPEDDLRGQRKYCDIHIYYHISSRYIRQASIQ